ncbi:hypothetical protein [Alkalimarinus sediminis]|uniref:Uncharacterized protein n=1 Tax=Alkalimarinus sediminis TaxID=1632866 RepID=A0A9E8KQY8_9ALTE|nr:hypothetical protein [Alkalimarinus sediminis]UZW75382.1 hypothetical protein NNL22_01900 [Alkalimarinus sediminis]
MQGGRFKTIVTHMSLSALVLCGSANAELASLSDGELSEVDGAGVGLVFEDFIFDARTDAAAGQTFKISGIKDSTGTKDVAITVSQLYIANSGSNYGQNLSGVNLGRLVNPYEIELVDGDDIGIQDKAVLQFSAPKKYDATTVVNLDRDLDGQLDTQTDSAGVTSLKEYAANPEGYDCVLAGAAKGSGTCGSRPTGVDPVSSEAIVGERPDIGLKLQVQVGIETPDNLNIHAKSAVFDGSYLRLWGDDNKQQLVGEFRLNLYTPELSINSCDAAGQSCGNTIYMKNFELELALGNRFQPMSIGVTESLTGAIQPGNFVFEVASIADYATSQGYLANLPGDGKRASCTTANCTAAWDFFNDYYSNPAYKSNLRVGALHIGDIAAGGQNFGSSRIEGMTIQYLKISSHDLAN